MLFESLGLKDGESHHMSNMAGGQMMIGLVDADEVCGWSAEYQCGLSVGIAPWNPCGAAKD